MMLDIRNDFFILFTIARAVNLDLRKLEAFRFLSGRVGATSRTLSSGTIADVMPPGKWIIAEQSLSWSTLFD